MARRSSAPLAPREDSASAIAIETPAAPAAARKGSPARASRASRATSTPMIDPERRRALIAEAAYFRAERRGFAPGYETEDWLAAELEVDTALTVGVPSGKKGPPLQ